MLGWFVPNSNSSMGNSGRTGLNRVFHAALYSIRGLEAAWKHEAAFRQEVALCVFMIPGAFWVGGTAVERSVLIGSCVIVLIVELLNSGIEAITDRVGTDYHTLSGRAKDLGSAAVLLSLLLAGLVWGLIGWQNFAAG
jgi:diacylglycerol kinase (ATP)